VRILRIADVPDNRTGGMTRAMYGGGDVLAAMGHQVDYLFSENIHPRSRVIPARFDVPLKLPKIIRELQRQRGDYDVVEIHEPLAAPFCWQRKYLHNLPPLVLFSHGAEGRHRERQIAYKRQIGLPVSPRERYLPVVAWQSMYAMRRADQILCLNSLDQAFLINAGVHHDAITRLRLGVDDAFLERPDDRRETTLVTHFLFLGTWIMRKGIRELAAAMTQLMDQRPGITLTIAGFGVPPETVRASFPSQYAPRLNLIAKLEGTQTLIDLYGQQQVLILPSFFEGQPLVMLEAAALGLAIVATDESGMHDFIESDRDGLLVPVGDETALAAALLRLCDDPALAFGLGTAAREKVQKFTWSQSAQMLLGAYQKAIERA
jgi:glycosyltransferase involved in cell wall biosynthesis